VGESFGGWDDEEDEQALTGDAGVSVGALDVPVDILEEPFAAGLSLTLAW
jgi:hypothetical protein